MKIAVLLKGQPRQPKLGAVAFKKFFPHESTDVKLFGHFWTTDDYARTEDNSLVELVPNNILNNLQDWNFSSLSITDYDHVFKLLFNIDNVNLAQLDFKLYDIMLTYLEHEKQNIRDFPLLLALLPNIGYYKKNSNSFHEFDGAKEKINRIMLMHKTFSQMISAGKVFEEYKKFSIENNWYPDLVIMTRTDLVSKYGYNILENILADSDNKIYGNCENNGYNFYDGNKFSDLLMITNSKTADLIYANLEEKIFNFVTKHKIKTINLALTSLTAEAVWTSILSMHNNYINFISCNITTMIIRENYTEDDVLHKSYEELSEDKLNAHKLWHTKHSPYNNNQYHKFFINFMKRHNLC